MGCPRLTAYFNRCGELVGPDVENRWCEHLSVQSGRSVFAARDLANIQSLIETVVIAQEFSFRGYRLRPFLVCFHRVNAEGDLAWPLCIHLDTRELASAEFFGGIHQKKKLKLQSTKQKYYFKTLWLGARDES